MGGVAITGCAAWSPGPLAAAGDPGQGGGLRGLDWLWTGLLPDHGPDPWVRAAAIFFLAASVKLMDDVLDRPQDALADRPNWAQRWGPATTAYGLAALLLAAALSLRDAFALFWACYGWGMAHGARQRLPSGLRAWQETVLALALAVLGTGLGETAFALAVIGSIQLADDWWDLRQGGRAARGEKPPEREPVAGLDPPQGSSGSGEPHPPPGNWAARLGGTETALAAAALALAALAYDPWRTGSAWLSALSITAATHRWASPRLVFPLPDDGRPDPREGADEDGHRYPGTVRSGQRAGSFPQKRGPMG